MKKLLITILISGRGSNLEAILRASQDGKLPLCQIAGVLSDQPGAYGLKIAQRYRVPALYLDPGPFKTKLDPAAEIRYIEKLREWKTDLVCLAGFMRIVKKELIRAFSGRILNIHPSLLPRFPGLNAQAQALAAGATETGCTVHLVDEGVDTGEILGQRRVPITPQDNEDSLSDKILKEEHILYTEVIRQISEGRIHLDHKI